MIKKNVYEKIRGLLNLTRIKEWWLISFSFIIFAYVPHIYRIHDNMRLEYIIALFLSPPIYLTTIIVFSAQIFLFAGNDYFDRHVDALDREKRNRNPVCSGKVNKNEVWILLGVSAIISLLVSILYNFQTLIFTTISLFVFYFYTAEPIRFKKRVGFDIITHAIFINVFPYFSAMIALWDFHFEALFILFIFIARSSVAQLLQEIRDYDVDKKVEKNTVIVIGRRTATKIIFIIWSLVLFTTIILLIAYQLFSIGLRLFFILIVFICIIYAPSFYKLLTSKNYPKLIESLWVGNGKTSPRIAGYYLVTISVYLFIVFFFLL